MATLASRGVPTALFTSATTGTSAPLAIPISSKNVRIHVQGNGGIVAGTLILEEALDPTRTTSWSTLQSVALSSVTGGAEQVIHIVGTFSAIRGRITVDVTGGGNVTVHLVTD